MQALRLRGGFGRSTHGSIVKTLNRDAGEAAFFNTITNQLERMASYER